MQFALLVWIVKFFIVLPRTFSIITFLLAAYESAIDADEAQATIEDGELLNFPSAIDESEVGFWFPFY